MHAITSTRTYATVVENAEKALDKTLATMGKTRDQFRWFVAVGQDRRFVPTVLLHGGEHGNLQFALPLAQAGVMVLA